MRSHAPHVFFLFTAVTLLLVGFIMTLSRVSNAVSVPSDVYEEEAGYDTEDKQDVVGNEIDY